MWVRPLLAMLALALPAAPGAEAQAAPVCTTRLELGPARVVPPPGRPALAVSLRYRPVPLDPATLTLLHRRPRARAFFNARVLRRLLRLHTDVDLRRGKQRLPAGTYDAGFRCRALDRWEFVVLDRRDRVVFRAPLSLQGVDALVPCLNVSLLPGQDGHRLVLAFRYGNLRSHLELRWALPRPPEGGPQRMRTNSSVPTGTRARRGAMSARKRAASPG